MVLLVFLALFGFLCWYSVFIRTIVFSPLKSAFYAFHDVVDYFKFKKYNLLQTGHIIAYVALFGRGKTLSVVHYVRSVFFRYNNKRVFDFGRGKWVTQRVLILSNVDLTDVPYVKLDSLQQIVDLAEYNRLYDLKNDTRTCTIVLGDEFSVQLNSRQFKNNIDPLFLNTLLTCRHHNISLIYDAQRFNHVDALLRQVTSDVISCKKIWRVMVSEVFDAWQLENSSSPDLVSPIRRFGWFITDSDFNAYDTLACVGNLIKKCKENDLLSEDEILQHLNNSNTIVNVSAPAGTGKFKRKRKK